MRKSIYTLFIIILIFIVKSGQSQNPIWTDGTAFTIAHKKVEISLFRPTKIGISRKSELSIHPLGAIVLPHLFHKRRWVKFRLFNGNYMLSSRHGVYFPSWALRLTRNLNIFKLLPEDTQIPNSICFQNELILSRFLQEPSHCYPGDILLTGRIGCKYSFGWEESTPPIIYRSVLFRETMVVYPKLVWYVGVEIDGYLNYMFNYFADLDFYSVRLLDYWSVESKFGVMGYLGEHWSAFVGLKLAFSTMSDRNRFLFLPIAGVSYTFKYERKNKGRKGLFGRKMYKYQNSDLEGEIKYRKNPDLGKDSIQNNYNDSIPRRKF